MKTLNTRLWNLGTASVIGTLSAAAVGCSPAIEVDSDGGSDTDGPGETDDPRDPRDPSDTDPPQDPEGCASNTDCPDGFYCSDGECFEEYEYECDDSGDCYCYYGHCTPEYECYSDEDCGDGEICEGYEYGYCNTLQQIPECDSFVELQGTQLEIPADEGVLSLSFVDLDPATPGEDLVVGTVAGGVLIPSGGEAIQLAAEQSIRAAVSTDLDGDGDTDLITIDDATLRILYSVQTEAVEASLPNDAGPFVSLEVLANENGLPSLVVASASGEAFYVPGSSRRSLELLSIGARDSVAAAPAVYSDEEAGEGVLFESQNARTSLYRPGERSLEIGRPGREGRVRAIMAGSLRGAERDDVVWASTYETWTLFDVWLGEDPPVYWASQVAYEAFEIGDFDGNGRDDVIALGQGYLDVLPGHEEWGVTCLTTELLDVATPSINAVGDLDADGNDELVVLFAGTPVLYDVTWVR